MKRHVCPAHGKSPDKIDSSKRNDDRAHAGDHAVLRQCVENLAKSILPPGLQPGHEKKVHQPGIEPGSRRWQRCILPLDH